MPHFVNILEISSTYSGRTKSSIRSCDSDSMISYGDIASSRVGTMEVLMKIPNSALLAASTVELVSPAAPRSWMPSTCPVARASKHPSISSFSRNGLPT